MMTSTPLAPALSNPPEPFTDQLRLAVAAYLARFKGSSREHTESDLRCYLAWCAGHGLDPLAAQRPHLESYIRWMQEIRRFKPSTVSRRFSVVAGFYRTCALDGVLQHSPDEHVRRPVVPAGPPTADIADLGEEHEPPGPAGMRQRYRGRPGPAAARGRPGHRPGGRLSGPRADPAEHLRLPDGPARGHPSPAASRRDRRHPDRQSAPAHAASDICYDHARRWRRPTRRPDRHQVGPARTWTATRTTSWPPTWPPAPDLAYVSRGSSRAGDVRYCRNEYVTP